MVTTPMSTLRAEKHSILGWTGQVLAWFVIAGVLVLLTLAVLVPRVGGATPYTILTGSMEPGLPPGTLVVVKPVPADRIAIGSVITYQLDSGTPDRRHAPRGAGRHRRNGTTGSSPRRATRTMRPIRTPCFLLR